MQFNLKSSLSFQKEKEKKEKSFLSAELTVTEGYLRAGNRDIYYITSLPAACASNSNISPSLGMQVTNIS